MLISLNADFHQTGKKKRDSSDVGSVVSAANAALWGVKSLAERFGVLDGRELQDKIFELYQARIPPLVHTSNYATTDCDTTYFTSLSDCIFKLPHNLIQMHIASLFASWSSLELTLLLSNLPPLCASKHIWTCLQVKAADGSCFHNIAWLIAGGNSGRSFGNLGSLGVKRLASRCIRTWNMI